MTIDGTAIEEIANLATGASEPAELTLGSYYTVVVGGQLHKIDLTGDAYHDQPKRKTGRYTVRDVPSFHTYWLKHQRDEISELYADRQSLTVTAVLDAHGTDDDATGWGEHRLVLALKHSTAYNAWKSRDGHEMTQEEFANFLEDNRADIHTPAAAEMLEVAQSLQSVSKVDFAAGFRLVDGQRRLSYVETTESRAGTKGELAIPAEIVIAVPIFEGADEADVITARFRHRIVSGGLRLSYRLDRPDDVVSAAYDGVVAEVSAACDATVMRGTPA